MTDYESAQERDEGHLSMTDYESAQERDARMLALVKAHPSYEAVKATKEYGEPSLAELEEHAETEAFAALPRAQKLAAMVDALLVQARNQVRHNGPVSPGMVKELEAIRALLD